MDFFSAFKIASQGLASQRARMNVITSNLANAETTRRADGTGPYRRKDIVFTTVRGSRDEFGNQLKDALSSAVHGVAVAGIREDPNPPRLVFNPQHPDANKEGYVAMPNINIVEEMVNMMQAQRSYEANANSIDASRKMAGAAIDLIK